MVHCDSGVRCASHQSPSALKAVSRYGRHFTHSASATSCSLQSPSLSTNPGMQKGHFACPMPCLHSSVACEGVADAASTPALCDPCSPGRLFSISAGLQAAHCDSGAVCSAHQSPLALNAARRYGRHWAHNASATPCSPQNPPASTNCGLQNGHCACLMSWGHRASEPTASAAGAPSGSLDLPQPNKLHARHAMNAMTK